MYHIANISIAYVYQTFVTSHVSFVYLFDISRLFDPMCYFLPHE
jgi:hypothetical protein